LKPRLRHFAFGICGAALVGAGLGACVQYNEDCAPLVDDPDAIVGYLASDVNITKQVVRSGDNALGQMVADAYRHAADDASAGTAPAQVGFENSGDIRNDWVCQTIDSVPRGPVRKKTLRQVLPFDDSVSLVSIDIATLKSVLEHSVAGFAASAAGAPATPPGSFLQMSGVTAEVDCSMPAQSATDPGARITRITLQDSVPADGGGLGTVLYDASLGQPPSTTNAVRIAVNSFVLSGGDGYGMLKALDGGAVQRFDLPGLNFQIAAQYFQKTYPQASPLPGTPATRWVFRGCAGTLQP
jgi:5'-nucleotidase / UDP-sugar diphosphatase